MLIVSLSQLQDDPLRGLVSLVTYSLALVVAITFHEFSHALAATGLGDQTPRRLGRLSLRPFAHLDPVGTTMIFVAGFGWGKPVTVNPANLRTEPRSGMAVVALAGPLSNVALAALIAIPIRAGITDPAFLGFSLFNGDMDQVMGYAFGSLVFWNLLLASFNLIPLAPLDGFKVALGVLPREAASSFSRLERHGPTILLLLIMFDLLVPGRGILFSIIQPIVNVLGLIVVGRQVL